MRVCARGRCAGAALPDNPLFVPGAVAVAGEVLFVLLMGSLTMAMAGGEEEGVLDAAAPQAMAESAVVDEIGEQVVDEKATNKEALGGGADTGEGMGGSGTD